MWTGCDLLPHTDKAVVDETQLMSDKAVVDETQLMSDKAVVDESSCPQGAYDPRLRAGGAI